MNKFDAEMLDDRSVWTERHLLAGDIVTSEYRNAVYALIGKSNAAPFRGFPAGGVVCVQVKGEALYGRGGWCMIFGFSTPIFIDASTADKSGVIYLASRHKQADFSVLGIGQ